MTYTIMGLTVALVITLFANGLREENSSPPFYCPESPIRCKCFFEDNSTMCTKEDRFITYIPYFPDFFKSISYKKKLLENITENTFKNITVGNLKRLNLENNGIVNITKDAFSGFTKLQYLSLSDNTRLTAETVKRSLSGFASCSLNTLVLRRMKWKTLPKDMFDELSGCNITDIILRSNDFSTFDFKVFRAVEKTLQYLDLSRNSILVMTIRHLPMLNVLLLRRNKLLVSPNFCGRNTSLTESLTNLDLSYNRLSPDASSFVCLDSLDTLYIDGNPINVLPNNLIASLPSLNTFHCCRLIGAFWKIESYAFNSSSLKTLVITRNYFKFMFSSFDAYNIFKNCPNLEKLKLGKNHLNITEEKMEIMLRPLTNLRSLSLYSASISHIPNIFQYMPNLTELVVSNNQIHGWKKDLFDGVTSLRYLNLKNNKIQLINSSSFPPSLTSSIYTLFLNGNPFSCTCDLKWFIHWIKNTVPGINMHLNGWPENYRCAFPPEMNEKQLVNFNPTEQTCAPLEHHVVTAVCVSVSVVGGLVCFLVLVTYKARWHIRYWIHLMRSKRRQKHDFRSDDDFLYDGFVVYCDEDMEWVHGILLPELEEHDSFKLCIHFRDFEVGKLIVDNIHESIMSSRKIIIVMSKNFFKSQWCQFEVRLAQSRFFAEDNDPLILVLLEDITSKHMSGLVRTLFTTTTYGIWSQDRTALTLFWDQLKSSLRH